MIQLKHDCLAFRTGVCSNQHCGLVKPNQDCDSPMGRGGKQTTICSHFSTKSWQSQIACTLLGLITTTAGRLAQVQQATAQALAAPPALMVRISMCVCCYLTRVQGADARLRLLQHPYTSNISAQGRRLFGLRKWPGLLQENAILTW